MSLSHPPELHELSNGISVVLQNVDSPVASLYWWNNVGSADESRGEEGFAHFLEHMLFKDSEARDRGQASTGQLARKIESLGGDINAYTSFEQTVYHVTCAAQHLEKVFDSFGTMAEPQKFLKLDFEREREVILEELKKNEDSPSRRLFQELFSATYRKHPYRRPIIGFKKTLKNAKLSELERFRRNHYVPENMGVVVVGPLEKQRDRVLKLLEKRFGSKVIKPKKYQPIRRVSEKLVRDEIDFRSISFDVQQPSLSIAFRVPDLNHEDIPALDLLSNILGMGESARLYQRLFYQESIVNDVNVGLYVPRDNGMFYVFADLQSEEQIEKSLESILGELNRLRQEGPTAEEMQRVIVNTESDKLYSVQTVDGIASRLGFMKFSVDDLNFDESYLAKIRSVTPEEIQRIISKYLTADRVGGAVMVKKGSAYDEKPLVEILRKKLPFSPVLAKEKKASKTTQSAGRPDIYRLPSGLTVVHRHRKDSQVVSLQAAVLGGSRLELLSQEAEQSWGASYLLSQTWTKGTSQRKSQEISRLVEGMAADIDGFSGRNTIGLQSTGLVRDWDTLSKIFSEVLIDASFPEEELEHSRRVTLDAIRSIEDHSAQLCSRLFLETLFEKHPYGRSVLGSIESVQSLDRNRIASFHRNWVRPDRLVLSVSGGVSPSAVRNWANAIEKDLGEGGSEFSFSNPNEDLLKAPRWVERQLGREQVHLLVGGMGMSLDSKDRLPFQVLQTILGGQSGRLFIELREKKSLAYTVATSHFEGIEPGYVGTYIACSPDKREEALKGIRVVLEKLANKGPTETEMKRAREYFLGSRAMTMQTESALASYQLLETIYGNPVQSVDDWRRAIGKVSATRVKKRCADYFVKPPMVTATVG